MRVAAYALAISLGAGILFGLSPALQLTKRDLATALKHEGAGMGYLRGSWMRSFLIAAQVAVSMFLLASAGLLTRGLVRSLSADPGFETRHVFVVAADFAAGGEPAKAIDRKRLLAAQLRERPELGSGAMGGHPLNGGEWYPPIVTGHSQGRVTAGFASENYLPLLGIPVLRGRNFTAQEAASGAPLAIVSDSTARRLWPNENPLGKHFTLDMDPHFDGAFTDFEVVGIVRDVRFDNPTRVDPTHVYLPAGGPGSKRVAFAHHSTLEVLVRFQGNRQGALSAVETTIEAFDKNLLPSLRLINIEDDARDQRAVSQLLAMLATILAVLAVTLAGIGVYGVIAYLVSQRTREIGIRMALGANSGAVFKNVILQGLRPVFAGLILGLAAAAGLSSVLHWALFLPGAWDLLYGVPFYDPVTFGGMICFVMGIAGLASAVPARRALSVDPITALRYE
jgi:predicted permease